MQDPTAGIFKVRDETEDKKNAPLGAKPLLLKKSFVLQPLNSQPLLLSLLADAAASWSAEEDGVLTSVMDGLPKNTTDWALVAAVTGRKEAACQER